MSNKNRTVYVVGQSFNYTNWTQSIQVPEMKEADYVLFTGGEDIDPSIYNRESHPTTYSNPKRDKEEIAAFKEAEKLGKPILGICRGAQLLCAMNGGILIQHQDNKYHLHYMKTTNGVDIVTSSLHHQAAYPFILPKNKYKILAWTNGLSDWHFGQSWKDKIKPEKECEVVYYPENRHLGIQGHPEMLYHMRHNDEEIQKAIQYFRGLLTNLLENKL